MRTGTYPHFPSSGSPATANQGLADRSGAHAAGALAGQKVRQRLRDGDDPSIAFDELLELADRHGGLNTLACAGFIRELAKACR